MKFRKLALVLVIVLLASTLAPAFAKSPFADVPADHWAYDSIVELAAAGLIEGYPDGTYGGARMMTRYEAAMVFARALARLESRIDVLPELNRIKAELVEEIKAQLAAFEAPVQPSVETKVIEKVIVDKDVDAETLARIRANEIAAQALEGDIAYVENRVLGLVDGLRYDVNQMQEQIGELEIPSLEDIEALFAERIEEGLLEAARSAQAVVQEPTVIEKVIVMEAELTEKEVEFIAQELITQQVQKYVRFIVDAFSEDIAELNKRVAALEEAQKGFASKADLAAVEADVAAVKGDVAAVQADVKALQKVRLSGTLTLGGKYDLPRGKEEKEYSFSSNAGIALNLKFDKANVVANFGGNAFGHLDTGKVVVTSETPLKRLSVGKLGKIGIGNEYVLGTKEYDYAGLASLDLVDGLGSTILLGLDSETDPLIAGLAFSYEFIPELGVKAAFAAEKAPETKPEPRAVGAGIFGKIAGVTYGGNFAMNLQAEAVDEDEKAENTVFDVNLAFAVGPLKLDGKYINQAKNFGSGEFNSIEAGVKTDALLGIDLAGRFYRKAVGEETQVNAYLLTANKGFELSGLPVTLDARYAGAVQPVEDEDDETAHNVFAKLAVEKKADMGLRYGASASYEKNVLKDGNWKGFAAYLPETVAKLAANVGYKLDWRGAVVDLGYGAGFDIPIEELEEDEVGTPKTLTHNLSVGYNFTKDVKLTLGSRVVQTLSEPIANDFTYNAGLTISF